MNDKLTSIIAFAIITIIIVVFFACCDDDKSDVTPLAQSNHYSSYHGSDWSKPHKYDGTNKSYGSLNDYYEISDDGHIIRPKEGTIRNGKPYHKEN